MNGPANIADLKPHTARMALRDDRLDALLGHPVALTILRLAVPNSTVMLVQVLMGLLEVYFIAKLGLDALAGVTLVFPLLALTVAISQGATGGGIVTSVARALGRGEFAEASSYPWYAIGLALPLGLATTAFMYGLGPLIYRAMGGHGASLQISLQYSTVVFGGATLIWTFNLLMAAVRGTGNLRLPVIVVCSGATLLVPLSPLLIFGGFGIPALGPIGGGVALLINYALGTLAYAIYLWGHMGLLRPSPTPPRLALAPALTILKIGGVSAIIAASTNVTLTLVTAYVGSHGIAALAGYGSASRLEFLLVPISYGVGGPVGMVVSASLGAGLIERARRAAWTGAVIGAAVTATIGLCRCAVSAPMDRPFQRRPRDHPGGRAVPARCRPLLWVLRSRLCAVLCRPRHPAARGFAARSSDPRADRCCGRLSAATLECEPRPELFRSLCWDDGVRVDTAF